MDEPFCQHGMPPLTPNPTESILPNQQALIEPCNSTCEGMIVGSALGSALVQKPPMAFIPDHSSWPSQNSFQQAQICLNLRLPELDTARNYFCLTTENGQSTPFSIIFSFPEQGHIQMSIMDHSWHVPTSKLCQGPVWNTVHSPTARLSSH